MWTRQRGSSLRDIGCHVGHQIAADTSPRDDRPELDAALTGALGSVIDLGE